MVKQTVSGVFIWLLLGAFGFSARAAEGIGSIRGSVYDGDFGMPLGEVSIVIPELNLTVQTNSEGLFVFPEAAPGTYTLIFSKSGYTRQVRSDVLVQAGQMTELNVSLAGDFTDIEEFVVEDLQMGAGTEAALLDLRMESPALMDSISADLMSRAGASDAASALRLVAGATIQDGKYAVIRGLPDRYVNSQMNGVRLPTADADKRAVQLDQFPAAAIENIQVSKTFTPDQQGDASGGAVNIILKGVPNERTLKADYSASWDYPSAGSRFLGYRGGGVNRWGKDEGERDIQFDRLGMNWNGAVGVSPEEQPRDYKWSLSGGDKFDLADGTRLGGFGSFFYEKDSSYKEGRDDAYWVRSPGQPMTPRQSQIEGWDAFKTSLWDIRESTQSVQWGTLGTAGIELEDHRFSILYLYTRLAEDTAMLAENTRGKKNLHRYWPTFFGPEFDNYDPYNPDHPGNAETPDASPYLRSETLEYTERTTRTLQFSGRHTLFDLDLSLGRWLRTLPPEVDWKIAYSSAGMVQPDKRMFGTKWYPLIEGGQVVGRHQPFKPSANFTMGYLQRVWKEITEDSEQYQINLKLPFEQWGGQEGYLKFGFFEDTVTRQYNQESFANFADNQMGPKRPWEFYWSSTFPTENHPITAGQVDVDYKGLQKISAWYYMMDMPLTSQFNLIGGSRVEKTTLDIVNQPESQVFWYPKGSYTAVKLNPGDADVSTQQTDVLPSIGFQYRPWDPITLRGSYSETIARQTLKELTPIMQSEYLGGDVFIGNPDLQTSSLKNYDLRLDYTPYAGSLVSVSWFHKKVKDPIEYVQRVTASFDYTTAVNYPEGQMSGYELEVRQDLARFWESMNGLSVGGNATLINSEVTLPPDEAERFNHPNVRAPMTKRDMTNAPAYLYNIYMTYDVPEVKTQLALFYTVRGDTLVAGASPGAGQTRVLIPSLYETEYGTLNFSLTQPLGSIWKLKFQAKNLLDPEIKTVYRSKYIGDDVTKSTYRKGMEFSLSLSASF